MSPWQQCLERLEGELSPQLFNTWIRPLQAEIDQSEIRLLAPNRFVKDWVNEQYYSSIHDHLSNILEEDFKLTISVGSQVVSANKPVNKEAPAPIATPNSPGGSPQKRSHNLNADFHLLQLCGG